MSYDFYMEALEVGCEHDNFFVFTDPPWITFEVHEVADLNYTSNVRPMWDRALGFSIRDLQGRLGADIEDDLRRAHDNMVNNPDDYIPMNPSNNWGRYEGATEVLERLLIWSRTWPNAILTMSY